MPKKEKQNRTGRTKAKVKPELPAGFRDYLPKEMIAREKMIDTIREVFERFGFDPIDTPIVEKLNVLTGKSKEFKMNLFRVGIVPGLQEPDPRAFREMALRFDLTVPLARVVSANLDLPKPFKRYQLGYVFRGERSQKGRFRGFLQFDADIVGSDSVLADTEIIWLIIETMKALGVKNFVVNINNRKILEGLAQVIGFAHPVERKQEVFRILDKINKVGWDEVSRELSRSRGGENDISSPNLSLQAIESIKEFFEIQGSPEEVFSRLKEIFKKKAEIGVEGVKELQEIVENLRLLDLSEDNWKIDLSIVRGLDYYTGAVFETVLPDLPRIGSVFSGGRYDTLVNIFSGVRLAATGASIGVDRLFTAMEELNLLEKTPTAVEVLVVFFDPKLKNEYLKIVKKLREAGVRADFYLKTEPFRSQLNYALKRGIPTVVIMGSDEKKKGVVSVKDLNKKTQKEVPQKDLVPFLKKVLTKK